MLIRRGIVIAALALVACSVLVACAQEAATPAISENASSGGSNAVGASASSGGASSASGDDDGTSSANSSASGSDVASSASTSASAAPKHASNDAFAEINDIDDRAIREKEERERREAAERERQAHEAEWRARFPTDDYSNTLLIGDSLMQNATASLTAAMPGVTVDADAGRTLEYGGLVFENESPDQGVLDHVRRDGGAYDRYVIGTGNNDLGGMPVEAAQEIVDCLGPDKQIYFITMCSMRNENGSIITNASIDAMVEQHDNVHKIDWREMLRGQEYEYLSDGIHVIRSREPEYAAFIKQGLDIIH